MLRPSISMTAGPLLFSHPGSRSSMPPFIPVQKTKLIMQTIRMAAIQKRLFFWKVMKGLNAIRFLGLGRHIRRSEHVQDLTTRVTIGYWVIEEVLFQHLDH